jgi:hypothetical protein
MIGAGEMEYLVNPYAFIESSVTVCQNQLAQWTEELKESMETLESQSEKLSLLAAEIVKRKNALQLASSYEISGATWKTEDAIAAETVAGWMNSPGHRANILGADYDEAGLGIAYVNGYVISTQVFIKRTSCGFLGAACCPSGAYQYCYEPNSCKNNVCGQ